MINLKEIKKLVLTGKIVEDILQKVDWKEFEKIVADIFQINGFKVKRNVRIKNKKRYEIDIIAYKDNISFCVDCKHWSSGRYKKSQIKVAAKKQKERSKVIRSLMNGRKIYPVIVTLFQEDLLKVEDVFIIPVWKLNTFLLEEIFKL